MPSRNISSANLAAKAASPNMTGEMGWTDPFNLKPAPVILCLKCLVFASSLSRNNVEVVKILKVSKAAPTRDGAKELENK